MQCVESLIFRQSLLALQKAHASFLGGKLPEPQAILLRKSIFAFGTIGRDCRAREVRIEATHHEMEVLLVEHVPCDANRCLGWDAFHLECSYPLCQVKVVVDGREVASYVASALSVLATL